MPTVFNLVLDGYSQPGASGNSLLGPAALGSTDPVLHPEKYADNAVLRIELDGEKAGTARGLDESTWNTTVQGLVINRFAAVGI